MLCNWWNNRIIHVPCNLNRNGSQFNILHRTWCVHYSTTQPIITYVQCLPANWVVWWLIFISCMLQIMKIVLKWLIFLCQVKIDPKYTIVEADGRRKRQTDDIYYSSANEEYRYKRDVSNETQVYGWVLPSVDLSVHSSYIQWVQWPQKQNMSLVESLPLLSFLGKLDLFLSGTLGSHISD